MVYRVPNLWSDFRPNNHFAVICLFFVCIMLFVDLWYSSGGSSCILYLNIFFFRLWRRSKSLLLICTTRTRSTYESKRRWQCFHFFTFLFTFFFASTFFLRTYLLCVCFFFVYCPVSTHVCRE